MIYLLTQTQQLSLHLNELFQPCEADSFRLNDLKEHIVWASAYMLWCIFGFSV